MHRCRSQIIASAVFPKRITLVVLLMLGGAALAHAADTVAPSDDFLEYLGNMENSDDNWTDLAAANETPSSAVTPEVNATPTPRMLNAEPPESAPHQHAEPTNAPTTAPPVAFKANK